MAELSRKSEGQDEPHIVRWETRVPDWRAFGWQEEVDPKFRRAQRLYIGTGGADKAADPEALEPTTFTLSVMEMPPGGINPMHDHMDNEYFFVLEGELTVIWEKDGVTLEEQVGPRDLVYVPPNMFRGARNDTDKKVLVQVLLDAPKPTLPHYEAGNSLEDLRLKREKAKTKRN